ncbi:MAG: hypothetical protein ACN4E2_02755 [Nitrospinota bacterium]
MTRILRFKMMRLSILILLITSTSLIVACDEHDNPGCAWSVFCDAREPWAGDVTLDQEVSPLVDEGGYPAIENRLYKVKTTFKYPDYCYDFISGNYTEEFFKHDDDDPQDSYIVITRTSFPVDENTTTPPLLGLGFFQQAQGSIVTDTNILLAVENRSPDCYHSSLQYAIVTCENTTTGLYDSYFNAVDVQFGFGGSWNIDDAGYNAENLMISHFYTSLTADGSNAYITEEAYSFYLSFVEEDGSPIECYNRTNYEAEFVRTF